MSEALIAINKSIEHWEDNLNKAYAGKLKRNDICGEKCSLCDKFFTRFNRCLECPLNIYGMRCSDESSPWKDVKNDIYDFKCTIESTSVMLMCLYLLREIYKGEKP
jgi:hypothetical protein